MEGLRVAQERRRTEFRIEYLMRRGIEERPRHEEAEDENKTAVGSGLGHDLVPSLQLNELFLFFGPICDARQLPVLIDAISSRGGIDAMGPDGAKRCSGAPLTLWWAAASECKPWHRGDSAAVEPSRTRGAVLS